MACFLAGFLIVFVAVGGVEASTDDMTMIMFTVIAVFGLAVMAIGTDSLRGSR